MSDVEPDPDVVETRHGLAVGGLRRSLLVAHAGNNVPIGEIVVFQYGGGCGYCCWCIHDISHFQIYCGTGTTRRLASLIRLR